jgi:hypothetical protein
MAEDDRVNGSRSKGHHNQPDQWQGHGPAPDVNAEASIPNAWRVSGCPRDRGIVLMTISDRRPGLGCHAGPAKAQGET